MKTLKVAQCYGVIFLALAGITSTHAQGTITFDHPLYGGTNYIQMGMRFGMVIPTRGTGSPNHDGFVVDNGPLEPSGLYMDFFRQFSPDNYVSFSLTNGSAFGLSSVQLADPNSPSLSPVPITFLGHLSGGGTVTNTFTTPGSGATTFQNYTFTAAFAGGLTSVDIQATRWAMDNLVFAVPEPSAACLLFTGGLLAYARFRRKH